MDQRGTGMPPVNTRRGQLRATIFADNIFDRPDSAVRSRWRSSDTVHDGPESVGRDVTADHPEILLSTSARAK
jgi:hypothetical protein